MRGKGQPCGQRGENGRITPAFAGKSITTGLRLTDQQGHPRVCGEKVQLQALKHRGLGSPPHMRGKGALAGNLEQRRGITPAHAGKRQCQSLP